MPEYHNAMAPEGFTGIKVIGALGGALAAGPWTCQSARAILTFR
jgi:hypothetical protein